MSLLDKFSEWLEKTLIFEMAYARQEARKIVLGRANPFSQHIIKLLVMPLAIERLHWKREILTWFQDMQDIELKPQNKKLDYETYRKWLIEEPNFNIQRFIRNLSEFYPGINVIIPENLDIDYLKIMEQICKNLANNDMVFAGINDERVLSFKI